MKRLAVATLFGSLLAFAPAAVSQAGPADAPRHVLSLDDVEITSLIDDVSIITGYTFILHPDVRRTKVTVMSQTPMSTAEVFQVFLSTLRVHGFAAVPAERGVYRIVPEQSAIGEATASGDDANSFVTEVFRLDYFNAIEAAQMVKPLIDTQGQVVANAKANTVIVVDYASNMPRLRDIIRGMDATGQGVIETIQLATVPAREMSNILEALFGGDERSRSEDFQVIASTTSNAIALSGRPDLVGKAIDIARELDASDRAQDTVRVLSLNNSDAANIVPILEVLAGSMAAQQSGIDSSSNAATIAHHDPTNSIIISATPDVMIAMERVVESLDTRRAQVLVEAIIVEMSDDTARELGVQFLLSGYGSSAVPFLSTNFSRSAPNLLGLAGALAGEDTFTGTNPFTTSAVSSLLGLEGGTVGGGGTDGDTLFAAVLNAVENDTNSRVLSKPFNMTLDNGTSQLVIGQEIPITTGEVLGDSNSNPFRTVQREKIGVKLEVTPKISSDNTVRLDIYQEVSSIFGGIENQASDLITTTREITTSVLADDKEIIVIGGLIEQTDQEASAQVPVLGDLPGVGNLFRSRGKAVKRTNLMVFIRPTIIRDQDDARNVTAQNYRYIQAESLLRDGQAGETSMMDDFINETFALPADLGTTAE
ncbi:MAG: type II secretion system secretin GspD [Henriciella sp.]